MNYDVRYFSLKGRGFDSWYVHSLPVGLVEQDALPARDIKLNSLYVPLDESVWQIW